MNKATLKTVPTDSGLTFLELIFVISIFAIMASIVVFRSGDFGAKLRLDNLAQDIALKLVEAQKSAIGGAINPNFIAADSKPTYGVYFRSGPDPSTTTTQFTFFNDLPPSGGDKLYQDTGPCPSSPSLSNECLSVTSITGGEYVSDICFIASSSRDCFTSPAAGDGEAHIAFTRPFPDASLHAGVAAGSPLSVDKVFIEVSSADKSQKRTIAVTSLGQIWVYDGAANTYGGF